MNDITTYANEIHKPVRNKFQRRSVNTFAPNDIWAIDLADVSNIKEDNDNVTFLLNIVDIYSRYAYSFPLKSKKPIDVLNAVKSIGVTPKNIWSDQGTEFYNKEFKKFCKDKEINLYHTYSNLKSVFVERFNRTLKEMMYKYFTEHNTDEYLDVLDDFVKTYNNTKHSRTKQKPIDVYLHGKIPYNKPNIIQGESKYKVGDYVRISKFKKTFEKGYTARWSKEVFQITDVDINQYPAMYTISDLQDEPIEGKFYEEELQPTDLKDFALIDKILQKKKIKGKQMYYVKYDGYDDKFNEWIDGKQLELLQSRDK